MSLSNPREFVGANNPPLPEQLALSEAEIAAEVEAIADRANALPRKIVVETAEADIAAIGGVIADSEKLSGRVEKRRQAVKDPHLRAGQAVDKFFGAFSDRLAKISTTFGRLVKDYRDEQRREQARIAAEVERQRRADEQERRHAAEEAERLGRDNSAQLERERADKAAREADEAAAAARAAARISATPTKATVGDVAMKTTAEWTFEIENYEMIPIETLRPYLKREHVEAALKLAVRMGARDVKGVRIFQSEKIKFT